MVFSKMHKLLPFKKFLWLLIGFALFIQLAVILYNNYSGFYELRNFQHFLLRLLRGTLLSIVAGFLIAYPDLILINYLNTIAPWGKRIFRRLLIQLLVAVLVAIVISIAVTLFANWLKPYTEDLNTVLVYNALIYSVVNIILMAILEGWLFSIESRKAQEIAKSLSEELAQIKFEVLKSQINPHFMFNSLNVLSGLIDNDTTKAQQFIDEFSHIYRYVLETIEHPVTTLARELEFMRSYLFLQQIRYGDTLSYSINIASSLLPLYLPPLSLQVVLENAIKHNIVNQSKPLHIEISQESMQLVVKNNIQPRVSMGQSTGLGLKNLEKRYALISRSQPTFTIENNFYIARLPLINNDEDESTDY